MRSTFSFGCVTCSFYFMFCCCCECESSSADLLSLSVSHIFYLFSFFSQINDKSRQSKLTAHSLILLNQCISRLFLCICVFRLMLFILTLILSEFDLIFLFYFLYVYLCCLRYKYFIHINIKPAKNECVNISIYQMKDHFTKTRRIMSKIENEIQSFPFFCQLKIE